MNAVGFCALYIISVTFSVRKATRASENKWNISGRVKVNVFGRISNHFPDSITSNKAPIQTIIAKLQTESNSRCNPGQVHLKKEYPQAKTKERKSFFKRNKWSWNHSKVPLCHLDYRFTAPWSLSHCHFIASSKEKQKRQQMRNEIHAANKMMKMFSHSVWRVGERLLFRRLKMKRLLQWHKVIYLSKHSCRIESNFFYSVRKKFSVFNGFEWECVCVSRMCIQMQCNAISFERIIMKPYHKWLSYNGRSCRFSIRILTAWINQKFFYIAII